MATKRTTTTAATTIPTAQPTFPIANNKTEDLPPSDTSPAVPQAIILKLLAFTLAMIVLPLSSFFFSRDWLFRGNAGYAGGFAAVIANVVLIAYIIVAFNDDKKERAEVEEEERKKKR